MDEVVGRQKLSQREGQTDVKLEIFMQGLPKKEAM